MTAAAILARLDALGVAVVARGESLALRPAAAVPPALLAEVKHHKAEVLAMLAANDVPLPDGQCDRSQPYLRESSRPAVPLPDDECDSPSIRAEPPPSPPDTRARAGLMAVATRRPPSWVNPYPHNPTQGSTCFCCGGRRWWSRDRLGWCCWTCHPPPLPLPAGLRVAEVVT